MSETDDILSYDRVVNEAQAQVVRDFSMSFGHVMQAEDFLLPILMVRWRGKLIGWVKIFNNTVGFTSWHPNLGVPPRIFKRAFEDLIAWAKIEAAMTGQILPCFVAKGDDSIIPDEILGKIGLTDSGFRLFKIQR